MIKICCDRCGKDIPNNTYYTITICAQMFQVGYGITAEGATTNIYAAFDPKRIYCEECKNAIANFISNEDVKKVRA